NTYCSWPSQQGFNCHFDPHEVFILQIDGYKEWFVFEETLEYPRKRDKSPDLEPPKSPYLNCTLSPGDVLYIPRGHWHYAIAREAPSLHLTLGLTCRTGIDWLTWLVENLQDDPAWRQNLPLILDGDKEQFDRHLQQLSDRLIETLQAQTLTQQFSRTYPLSGDRTPEIALPTQAGFDVFEAGLDTRFRPPLYQPLRIESLDDGEYRIYTADTQIELKGLTRECVEHLFSGESFTVWNLAEWLPDRDLETELLPLLLRLIEAGMLLVVADDDAGTR
ncbi:MAG: cupin domain-containing protein, partial [Cyanobacteriota bacterium]|nr:cupin domain-containing protein [Cyanobacteriota bacterium]